MEKEPMRASAWDSDMLQLLFILPVLSGCSGMGKDTEKEPQY